MSNSYDGFPSVGDSMMLGEMASALFEERKTTHVAFKIYHVESERFFNIEAVRRMNGLLYIDVLPDDPTSKATPCAP